ncbi:MlaD family protein [Nocardia yamanashiensis]|uniref:MlaD family protein n=1 Tax=Nocardia yamanashiensis TaxID=209247 RepID=UPI001E5D99B3|nr:MlaD family protein [Nocardia yamanashiensis]UGT38831.1 MlaD family protein [Nocardia yamanashiensis]
MKARALGPTLSLTAIAAVLVFGSAYLAFGVTGVDWFTGYTKLTMTLSNSGSLGPKSPVLLSGVRVGEITSVRNGSAGVQVDFRIRDDYRIPLSSTVTVENLSALGEPYVQFTPAKAAGAPYLRDGQRIDTAATRAPTSIPEVARQLTHLMNQLDPTAIAHLVDTFTQGLAGTETIVPQLARSTDLLAATLLARSGALHTMLTDLQTLGVQMDWTGPALSAAAPGWSALGGSFDNAAEAIAQIVRIGNVPEMYTTGTGLVPFTQELTSTLDQLGPDLAKLVPVLKPLSAIATSALQSIDLSALITQALAATGDGVVRLQITVK